MGGEILVGDAIDRDDIARVLLALQDKKLSRQADVAPALARVMKEDR